MCNFKKQNIMAATKEEKVIYKNDLVTVEFNEKSAYHKKGDREEVHRVMAEKFEKKGIAKIVK